MGRNWEPSEGVGRADLGRALVEGRVEEGELSHRGDVLCGQGLEPGGGATALRSGGPGDTDLVFENAMLQQKRAVFGA